MESISNGHAIRGTGYFVVGQETFHKAIKLGLNPVCGFLVLARGTGCDDVTTCWSAEAAAKRLGIRWGTAKAAIDDLAKARILTKSREGTRPSYVLAKRGRAIMLPNALIDGAAKELPPLRRVRQMQDLGALRLLVDLYAATDLPAWGGIDPGVVSAAYDVTRAGQRGNFVAWTITYRHASLTWGDVTNPHRLDKAAIPEGGNAGSAFWQRLYQLISEGLVQLVPTVFEGEAGEPMFPLVGATDIPIERELHAAVQAAGWHVAPEWRETDTLMVLPTRYARPFVRGVYRLRYRPQTAGTRFWFAENSRICGAYLRDLHRVSEGDTARTMRFGVHATGLDNEKSDAA